MWLLVLHHVTSTTEKSTDAYLSNMLYYQPKNMSQHGNRVLKWHGHHKPWISLPIGVRTPNSFWNYFSTWYPSISPTGIPLSVLGRHQRCVLFFRSIIYGVCLTVSVVVEEMFDFLKEWLHRIIDLWRLTTNSKDFLCACFRIAFLHFDVFSLI